MALTYGFAKARVTSKPMLKGTHRHREVQYHLNCNLDVGGEKWDVAINVGTTDADDLLKFKLVYDFRHPITETLSGADAGGTELTGQSALPALDFLRSDILSNTGRWRDSDVMDGSDAAEPAASLARLLSKAHSQELDFYLFGRFYSEGNGIHDTHMNQGSTDNEFLHREGDDSTDHNDVWQDGGLIVELKQPEWAAYFAAFDQQLVPTDDLGNPAEGAKPVGGD